MNLVMSPKVSPRLEREGAVFTHEGTELRVMGLMVSEFVVLTKGFRTEPTLKGPLVLILIRLMITGSMSFQPHTRPVATPTPLHLTLEERLSPMDGNVSPVVDWGRGDVGADGTGEVRPRFHSMPNLEMSLHPHLRDEGEGAVGALEESLLVDKEDMGPELNVRREDGLTEDAGVGIRCPPCHVKLLMLTHLDPILKDLTADRALGLELGWSVRVLEVDPEKGLGPE
jgi:hypothetical protein